MKFNAFIYSVGLGNIEAIPDGEIHRFKPPGRKTKSGWYILYPHLEYEAGAAGDWQSGLHEKFCSINKLELTPDQKKYHAKQIAINIEKNRVDTISKYLTAKNEVGELWGQASIENLDGHSYLIKKQIKTLNIRKHGFNIVIPIYDTNHILWNLQTINKNGFKLFHKGARIKGCYHPIGFLSNTLIQLILCEGWSTAMTIYQATGIATAACFSAGNLESVAMTLRAKYPSANIVIAGDDDQFKPVNIGRIKASIAAKRINAITVFPKFKDLSIKPTDFNDLCHLEGIETVREQFMVVCDVL
jgi:putative DNA primase/helicase